MYVVVRQMLKVEKMTLAENPRTVVSRRFLEEKGGSIIKLKRVFGYCVLNMLQLLGIFICSPLFLNRF